MNVILRLAFIAPARFLAWIFMVTWAPAVLGQVELAAMHRLVVSEANGMGYRVSLEITLHNVGNHDLSQLAVALVDPSSLLVESATANAQIRELPAGASVSVPLQLDVPLPGESLPIATPILLRGEGFDGDGVAREFSVVSQEAGS